jgi:predicted small secreted protein
MNPILITFSQCNAGTRLAGRLLFLAAVILAFAAGSTSCSTTRGFGQDIETTGGKIQEAATR